MNSIGVRQEPYAVTLHVRICAGGGQKWPSLPRPIESTIIGPPDTLADFRQIQRIRLLSGISDDQLVAEYQNASCFLMTAENTTANNAILEAMSCGLPIVAERVGGIPEYVTADCATLVERGDIEASVRAICAIRDSAAKKRQMAQAARVRAEELAWERVAEKMVAIYRNLAVSQ